MTKEIRKLIQKILDYLWEPEKKHWEECSGKNYSSGDRPVKGDNHIFASLVKLQNILNPHS